jgi:hypothetical protein
MDDLWPPSEVADDKIKDLQRLTVDVFHINIGTGDSAIYYLVQRPPKGAPADELPYVHRACLIDGGEASGATAIEDFLKGVRGLYRFNTTQGGRIDLKFPPFDSIVITHWDKGNVLYFTLESC